MKKLVSLFSAVAVFVACKGPVSPADVVNVSTDGLACIFAAFDLAELPVTPAAIEQLAQGCGMTVADVEKLVSAKKAANEKVAAAKAAGKK